MTRREQIAMVLVFGGAVFQVSAEEVGVGDAAPKLAVKEFIKGDPVTKFAKGKIYVVEFWATLCEPCVELIPHLTELQKKYKDVTFIGVSVGEAPSKAKAFVEKMGDKMDYRVATDAIPKGKNPLEGAMYKSWMMAAGQNSIPMTFIINGDGKIAWIGNSLEMDDPLEEIHAGKWDMKAAIEEFAEAKKEKSQR